MLVIQLQPAGTDALGQSSSAKLRLSCSYLLNITKLKRESINVAGEKIKVIISLDEGHDTKEHKGIALPIFGCSDSGHISGLILE